MNHERKLMRKRKIKACPICGQSYNPAKQDLAEFVMGKGSLIQFPCGCKMIKLK